MRRLALRIEGTTVLCGTTMPWRIFISGSFSKKGPLLLYIVSFDRLTFKEVSILYRKVHDQLSRVADSSRLEFRFLLELVHSSKV